MTTARPAWRKSSYSGTNSDCVEFTDLDERIAVRNSKRPDAGTLRLPAAAWAAFLAVVKAGGLD